MIGVGVSLWGSAPPVPMVRATPREVQFYSGTSDPAIPEIGDPGSLWTARDAARDSFLAIAVALSGTPPSIAGFTPLATISSGSVVSLAVYQLPGSVGAYAWVGANNTRSLIHLRDVGRIALRTRSRSGSATNTMSWGPLPAGDGDLIDEIASPAIVGGFAQATTAQTDIDNATTGVGLGGVYTTRFETNTLPARFAFDSAGTLPTTATPSETLISDFALVNDTFDTNGGYVGVLWAAEGAWVPA